MLKESQLNISKLHNKHIRICTQTSGSQKWKTVQATAHYFTRSFNKFLLSTYYMPLRTTQNITFKTRFEIEHRKYFLIKWKGFSTTKNHLSILFIHCIVYFMITSLHMFPALVTLKFYYLGFLEKLFLNNRSIVDL